MKKIKIKNPYFASKERNQELSMPLVHKCMLGIDRKSFTLIPSTRGLPGDNRRYAIHSHSVV
jgi:hypothetical protein